MCILRLLGLPTLDAALIEPSLPIAKCSERLRSFAKSLDLTRVLIRIENPYFRFTSRRGGDSTSVARAEHTMQQLHREGFAVIVMEPTNRFTNRLSMNSCLSRGGSMVIELLGPGFDVSDLNRGDVTPQFQASWRNIDWHRYDKPLWNDFTIQENYLHDNNRIRQRLRKLAPHVLGKPVDELEDDKILRVQEWLVEQGYSDLFNCEVLSLKSAARVLTAHFEELFLLGSYLFSKDRIPDESVCISASDLGGDKFVYWDLLMPSSLQLEDRPRPGTTRKEGTTSKKGCGTGI